MDNIITARTAVLTVLMRGGSYGLEIIDSVKEHTKGKVDLNEGSVYPVLKDLEREGLIKVSKSAPVAERGGRPRRYYELTAEGRRVAKGNTDALVAMLHLAEVL